MEYTDKDGRGQQMYSWLRNPSTENWCSKKKSSRDRVIITFLHRRRYLYKHACRGFNQCLQQEFLYVLMLGTWQILPGVAGKSREEEETPAQAEARQNAYKELKIGSFARIWSWMKRSTSQWANKLQVYMNVAIIQSPIEKYSWS